jgi:hypothetical protein
MRVHLDGQPLTDCRTLEEALAAATDAARARGRMVVDVIADGRRLGEHDLARATNLPEPFAELALGSAEPASLLRAALDDGSQTLRRIEAQQRTTRDQVDSGRLDEALDGLNRIAESWGQVKDVLERCAAVMGVDPASLAVSPPGRTDGTPVRSAADLVRGLGDSAGALRDAVAREDWSAVSDLLGFDLDTQCKSWQGVLATLADAVRPVGP